MTNITWILAIFMAAVFGLMIASLWYMKFLLFQFIGKNHEWIQFILDTKVAPVSWTRRYAKRISALVKAKANDNKITTIQKRACSKYIQRLDKLMHYVKASNLVESEDVRTQLIDQLLDIRKQWEREGFKWTHN